MSITCDKCKKEGTEEDPIFYVEALIKGIPILDSARDPDKLKERMKELKFQGIVTPCTIHLHQDCCKPMYKEMVKSIDKFIDPQEKKRGKAKPQKAP